MIYIVEELKDGKHWDEQAFTRQKDALDSVKEQMKTRKESKFVMRKYGRKGNVIEVRYF